MSFQSNEHWDIIIEPKTRRFSLNLREVWQYRDLLQMYVKRDIVTMYKQTILGPLWFIIQPLFTSIMLMFVFGGIANISTDGLPQMLFYMCGVMNWTYFAECLTKTSTTFTTNKDVFSKVYFPRLVIPISGVISNLIRLAIQLGLFLCMYLYFYYKGADIHFTTYIFLYPFFVVLLAALSLGFGIIISSLTTKYRDLAILFTFVVQLWMYATPIAYPLSVMKENYEQYMWIIQLNPVTSIMEAIRYAFMGVGTFSLESLAYSICFTIVILLIGIVIFNKVEKSFIDVV